MIDLLFYNCYNNHFRVCLHKKFSIIFNNSFDLQSFKKAHGLYGGVFISTKKMITPFLNKIVIDFYIVHVPKDILFIVNIHVIVVKNHLFILPLDKDEIAQFSILFVSSEKLYLYSIGLFEKDRFYLKFFTKMIRVKTVKIKQTVNRICYNNLFSFIDSILIDIIKLHGNNIFAGTFI